MSGTVEDEEDNAPQPELPQPTADIKNGMRKLREIGRRVRTSATERFRWDQIQRTMSLAHDSLCIPEDLEDGTELAVGGEDDDEEIEVAVQSLHTQSQGNLPLSRVTSTASNATPSPASPRKDKEALCLPRVVPNRWNSICIFLERACHLRTPIERFVQDARFNDLQITYGEWDELKKLKGFLKLGKTIMLQ